MRKIMVILTLMSMLTLSGCSLLGGDKPEQMPSTAKDSQSQPADEDHLSIEKDKITFQVSRQPKYFDKKLIIPEEGSVVAGLLISFKNDTQTDLEIDPKYVTIQTDDGKTHQMSPTKTAITGKGAFKYMLLPPSYRGGGLVLFEIPETVKLEKVFYDDQKGHKFEMLLTQPTGQV